MSELPRPPETELVPKEIQELRDSVKEVEGILEMAAGYADKKEVEGFLGHHMDLIGSVISETAHLLRRFGAEVVARAFVDSRTFYIQGSGTLSMAVVIGDHFSKTESSELEMAENFLLAVGKQAVSPEMRRAADDSATVIGEKLNFLRLLPTREEIANALKHRNITQDTVLLFEKLRTDSRRHIRWVTNFKIAEKMKANAKEILRILERMDSEGRIAAVEGIWSEASASGLDGWVVEDDNWMETHGLTDAFFEMLCQRNPIKAVQKFEGRLEDSGKLDEMIFIAARSGRQLHKIWDIVKRRNLTEAITRLVMETYPSSVVLDPGMAAAVDTYHLEKELATVLQQNGSYEVFSYARFPERWFEAIGKTRKEMVELCAVHQPNSLFDFFLSLENRQGYREAFLAFQKNFPVDKFHEHYAADEQSYGYMTKEALLGLFPWTSRLSEIENRQARTKNASHDPWRTDLAPLVRTLFKRGVLSPEDPGDVDYVLAFIDDFGMVNAPRLFELCVALWKADRLESLGDAHKKMIGDLLGARAAGRMRQGAEVVNALRAWRRDALRGLLRDEVPDGIESELGAEIFGTLLGSTSWGKGGKGPAEVLAIWKETLVRKPEIGRLPEGYAETSVRVAVRDRSEATDRPDEAAARAKILENADLRARLDAFRTAARESGQSPGVLVDSARRDLLQGIDRKLGKLLARLESAKGPAAAAMAAQRETLEKQRKDVEHALADREWTAGEAVRAFVSLGGLGLDVGAWIRTASAADMRADAPEAFARTFDDLASAEGVPTEGEVASAAELLEKYVREHYARSPFDGGDGEHAAAWADMGGALTEAWQLSDVQHPVLVAAGRLRDLSRGVLTRKTMDVALVPVRSALRLYAGDIGDACYAAKHELFAKGDYPNIQTMLFVTGRNTPNERLNGSVLFIETTDADGGRVLVVRANNPRENLLQQADGDALIAAVLDEARATAARRGIPRVGVVLDGASQASSNRSDVAAYYAKHFSDRPRIRLARTTETIFNGYGIWDDLGKHPVVEI